MTAAVIYKSLTGNTKLLADAVRDALVHEDEVYFGAPKQGVEADIYFVGSWTDKGMCDGEITEFLKNVDNGRIAFFGTAGFGGDESYYQSLFARVKTVIPPSNQILGSFYCQGKMPLGVRDRYVAMMREHPEDEKLEVSVRNFDQALSHPDERDLMDVKKWVQTILQKA